MNTIKIAILDSGVKKDHREFVGKTINARTLLTQDKNVVELDEGEDEIGHGTAVHYLIDKLTENTEIYDYKIFSKDSRLSLNDLVGVLSYIERSKIKFDIINISCGIVQCDEIDCLQRICQKIKKKGTVIVAAFDNDGAISFPAALDSVVGVDSSKGIQSINDFIYVENSLINVVGKNNIQKVAWTNPEYNMISGNSFTCCYVTAKIAKMMQDGDFDLKNISVRKIYNKVAKIIDRPFAITKAAVFPFNKETHSLARYESLLGFEIEGYYSAKSTGLIGKQISNILINCDNEKTIKNIDEIQWDEIDTLILGHLDELNLLLRKDYTRLLLSKAIENSVRIFSFDAVDKYIPYRDQSAFGIYTPRIFADNIQNNFGKLFKTNVPIVSIVGTSSSQGKFTLQLYIRKKLIELGYKVGQIGTEPTSELFGMDYSFPIGYNSSINLQSYDYLKIVNQMIWDISYKSEIIITGSQSSLATYSINNVSHFPLNHQVFLQSVQPDVVILCINPYDECEFIQKSINLINGLTSAKIIGAICFPLDLDDSWAGKMGRKKTIKMEKRKLLKEMMLSKFDLKLGFLDNTNEIDDLIKDFLYYFANQE